MHLRVPLAGAYPCGDFLPGYRSPCASHGDFKGLRITYPLVE